MTAEPGDTLMRDDDDDEDDDAPATLALSDDEARVLALYDQLRRIRLEIALLRARDAFAQGQGRGDVAAKPRRRAVYVRGCSGRAMLTTWMV